MRKLDPATITCTWCGEFDKLTWNQETRSRLIDYKRCFNCDFWIRLSAKDSGDRADSYIVTNGWTHYYIEPDGGTGAFRGFGGSPFVIKWHNEGREDTATRNLWHQGEVPELHRHRFTRNGEVHSVQYRLSSNGDLEEVR